MELSKQVTSLELSRRLKELGFEQESLWYFKVMDVDQWHEGDSLVLDSDAKIKNQNKPKANFFFMQNSQVSTEEKGENDLFSAFTVAELGEMLPERIKINHEEKSFSIFREKINETWDVVYSTNTDDDCGLWQQANTEADARAKMLIYLKENKYV